MDARCADHMGVDQGSPSSAGNPFSGKGPPCDPSKAANNPT